MCVRSSNAFYGIFNLDMGRSPGFGSTLTDFLRPIKTWFPFGSGPSVLNLASQRNSPDRSTKSTRFTLRCPTACKHRVSGSLSLPSRGSFHLSFTVLSSIGHWVVFSLTGWSPPVPTRFHVSRGTLDPTGFPWISRTGLSPSLAGFPKTILLSPGIPSVVRTPACTHAGLGSFPFARRYLGNHCCFLFLRVLRCFSSPGSPCTVMDSPYSDRSFSCRVSPFRHLRVTGYLLLSAAFRSLSRLSSAPSAKASALCSSSLDLSSLHRVCRLTVLFGSR